MPKCSRYGKQITTAPMVCEDCMPRWIPVTEELPEIEGESSDPVVLLIYADHVGKFLPIIGWRTEKGWTFLEKSNELSKKIKSEGVSYWMPLPPPPGGQQP